ncbi:hypothetical protein HZA44_01445 [Candidatus Peregrinibacteria bacterium]|nr:hypothetical protein [Candidatus Peregrinibacteria bacterium]
MGQDRTWCKYGDCELEKLESEFEILNKIWSGLEEKWAEPDDIEDVYRIYPLLDTTAALARKWLIKNGIKNPKYKVEIVVPSAKREVDTSDYLFPDEHDFFNGDKEERPLADIVSTCLHGSSYVYMDTRKNFHDRDGFEIYVFIETDKRAQYINIRSYINAISGLISDEIKERKKRL